MKKLIMLCLTIVATQTISAQMQNQPNTINVVGEGKMSVVPDQAIITIGAETKDKDSAKAKKTNDDIIAKVITVLKKSGINEKDYKTQQVSLYKTRDYNSKQDYFVASQSIQINLKDLSKYESLMLSMIDAGANNINGVEFKSSKVADYETEIRKKAVDNAKKKAGDFAVALNQKVGKAVMISDNSQTVYPRMYAMKAQMMSDSAESMQQTLAIGEIEITASVSISFELL